MFLEDISLLHCIDCQGRELQLSRGESSGEELRYGLLKCCSCGRLYPVIHGVGVFFQRAKMASYLSQDEGEELRQRGYSDALYADESKLSHNDRQLAVAKNWEYQWNEVESLTTKDLDGDDIYSAPMFWKFIPINPDNLNGKVVFVACGGQGIEAYHLSKCLPRRIIVNEIGSEIYRIEEKAGSHVLCLRSDLNYLPLNPETADVAICDHALQHVENYRAGFATIAKVVKNGGRVGICVYSWENNFLMTHLVEPAKPLLHFLPLKMLRWLSIIPAIMIYVAIHCFYVPLSKLLPGLARRVPLYAHMLFWAKNSFKSVWCSCFDLVHAPISYHFKEKELTQLAAENNLHVEILQNTHGTTWSMIAKK